MTGRSLRAVGEHPDPRFTRPLVALPPVVLGGLPAVTSYRRCEANELLVPTGAIDA
jgi:hypothetical protein